MNFRSLSLKMLVIFIAASIYTISVFSQATVRRTHSTQSIPQPFSPSTIEPLSVGDLVPDIELQMMNHSSPIARISDFKGKPIIIDFWATWCGPCITSFPKLDSLQKIFKDQLQILMVNAVETADDERKVDKFYQDWKKRYNRSLNLPTVINDSIITRLFRHSGMPHYVWIGPDGVVKAITGSKDVTKENIKKVINREKLSLPKKVDFINERFLFFGENTNIDSLSNFSFFIKGEIKGLSPFSTVRVSQISDSGLLLRGLAIRNKALLEIYRMALNFDKTFNQYNVDVRSILEVKHPLKILPRTLESPHKEILYSYDVIVPNSNADRLSEILLSDLNHHTDYYGRVEKREVKCFVLSCKKKTDKESLKILTNKVRNEETVIIESDVKHLVYLLNSSSDIGLPVVDETNYTQKFKIHESSLHNISKLIEELLLYGIEVKTEFRKVDMFVLSDKLK